MSIEKYGYEDLELKSPNITKEILEKEGWVINKYQLDKNKLEFELNDVYEIGGAFLKWWPSRQTIRIITVDEGHNMDGPNHSVKFHGKCENLHTFRMLCELINCKKL